MEKNHRELFVRIWSAVKLYNENTYKEGKDLFFEGLEEYKQIVIKEYKEKEEKKLKTKASLTEKCKEVLSFFNSEGDSHYKPIESNFTLIRARLKEYTVDEIKAVIKDKAKQVRLKQWDKKYYRPITIFNAQKFSAYYNESIDNAGPKSYKKKSLSKMNQPSK